MNIWRKLKIKVRNRWNNHEYRQAMIGTLIAIIILFTYLVLEMINMMRKNNAYGKLLPWFKMFSFSVFHVFGFIVTIHTLNSSYIHLFYKELQY